jgi:predicted lipid-binding transport protein (Tim44 family)
MGENIPFGDLIVFGAIALFIILRYRSVLGEKTGFDVSAPKAKKTDDTIISIATGKPIKEAAPVAAPDPHVPAENSKAAAALAAMSQMDVSFTPSYFMTGAKAAYEMVITAFNEHDRDTLKMLLDPDAYESFEMDMLEQEKNKTRAHTTLVAIKSADITEAELKKSTATITVLFTAEQVQVVRDEAGAILESGNSSSPEEIVDEWTFERDLKSKNPNWTIVAT